jgi:hypothetical protein
MLELQIGKSMYIGNITLQRRKKEERKFANNNDVNCDDILP